MVENIVLGIIQGIAEWLPISSEGSIVLAKTHLFGADEKIGQMIQVALFLHLGTVAAAAVYFRQEVALLLKTCFAFGKQDLKDKRLFNFLLVSTLISGAIGVVLLKILTEAATLVDANSHFITLVVGFLLLGTAGLELRSKHGGYKDAKDLKILDAVILGVAQGFAALPGLSRSGLTVSTLLLLKFDKACALKLSFLMSIPIVIAGNIVLSFGHLHWDAESSVGLLFSFLFGLLTIHLLLKVAEKINFGYFVLAFGILTICSAFI